MKPKITIYTDGSCKGNPGPGGWAAILMHGEKSKTISGSHKSTTNNRMELTAVIEAFKAIKKECQVKIFTDSKYVINGYESLEKWQQQNWKGANKKPLQNIDLWQELISVLLVIKIEIEFSWVKGHNGNFYNEQVDKIAQQEAGRV